MTNLGAVLTDPLISLSKDFLNNPYPTFTRLRNEAPVFWSKKGKYWLISCFDDADSVLKDLRFEKGFQKLQSLEPILKLIPFMSEQLKFRNKGMLNQNPPDHTRLRSLVNKAFTPTMVSGMKGHIQEIADSLINAVKNKGEMDLIADYAFVLPVTVIAEMLGIPSKDREQFKTWSHTLTQILQPIPNVLNVIKAGRANHQLISYLRPIIDERRKNPKSDLISTLTQAEVAGDKLSAEELIANIVLLLVAGHETTVNLISNGMLALLRNRDQLELLKSKSELISSAVDEFLRFDGPVQMVVRRAAASDITIKGQSINNGDMVIVLVGSANHDPKQYTNPDSLDITRTNNKNLAFGTGIHHCLGSALAQTEGQIAISTLINKLPNIKLKTTDLEYKLPFALRGVKSMPVAF